MGAELFDDLNSGFVSELLAAYLRAPDSVSEEWRDYFRRAPAELLERDQLVRRLRELVSDGLAAEDQNGQLLAAAPEQADGELLLGAVAAAMALVKAHRTHGHLAARLDPLGSDPPGDPSLEPSRLEPPLTLDLQRRIPTRVLRVSVPGETLADALPRLRDTYCGTMAYEIEHISSHEQRVWLRRSIESGEFRGPLGVDEQRALLVRLGEVEGFERYLRRTFLGSKQFSIEGLDVIVPVLDQVIELAAASGGSRVVVGMAHRGRLNVLAHTVGRSYGEILREFEGERMVEAVTADPEGGSGDVKYHHGAYGLRTTAADGEIGVHLASNPSHLEYVDPVIEGITRAVQTDHGLAEHRHDPGKALAVLVHGDAAFPGQGVVAETLNLQALPGYATGGTIHVIANNQVGFTTDPFQGRSTRYSSDLAKGFDVPIIHVNADDPEAAIGAARLAMAFREEFHHDVVVDLVGYRRFGHNEGDEPAYTQPLMVERIAAHPSVRAQYAASLVELGVVTEQEVEELAAAVQQAMREAHEALKDSFDEAIPAKRDERKLMPAEPVDVATTVSEELLRALNEELLAVPTGFVVNPKLLGQLARRRETLGREGGIDWAQAEALAFASLVCEGVPVRITGQDTERGTFSHRHLVLHDVQTGQTWTPMEHLSGARAPFQAYNSPLSEMAALGFEYGYSVAFPSGLVLWEAQFGDFVNSAQVIVDQFIVSGLSKWGQSSRLTLLLPHGYEGNGPEHSSARLERFMQLSAQENIRIVNCSTAAQYFHALRRQALHPEPRPLVFLTPKSLLRHRQSFSGIAELAEGSFDPIIDDTTLPAAARERARRLILCSGKVYYDIVGHEGRGQTTAVARLEQLYPFPVEPYAELLGCYPRLEQIVWTQEEPQNMGAWRAIRHRLEEGKPDGIELRYAGRPWRASPSEGYPTAHLLEQDRIVREALELPPLGH